jgi:2-hydroxychromene-2-carboxylate isomerase
MTTTFFFDLGSPYAHLAAQRLDLFVEPVDLQPISLGALFKLNGRSSWSLGDPARRAAGMGEVERRARARGLARIRWPDPWPGNYLFAMRAATFAAGAGRAREFMLCAFHLAFEEGLDLSVPANVLAAGADAGLDPEQVDAATNDPDIKLALRSATSAAHDLGVVGVPTIVTAGAEHSELFWGDDRLEEAAAVVNR